MTINESITLRVFLKILLLVSLLCTSKAYAISSNISAISESKEVAKEANAALNPDFDKSKPFGHNLFQGNFANKEFAGFSQDYVIVAEDIINVNLWGAINYSAALKVDAKGNIFIPEVGNIRVSGIRNKDLNAYLKKRITRVYHKNVRAYAVLESTRKINIFVGGFVNNPGLYEGMPSNSVIYYIDKAAGIDLDRGSFTQVQVVRNNKVLKEINLYDFIISGSIDKFQLQQGDVINILPKKDIITVLGDVRNDNQFEIDQTVLGADVMKWSNVIRTSNNVIVTRSVGAKIDNYYLTMKNFETFKVKPSDVIEFASQKKISRIKISLEGEYLGSRVRIHPYDATLEDVLSNLKTTKLAAKNAIILERESVAKKQKQMLNSNLDILENEFLAQSPISTEDAKIRVEEMTILEKFIEKARQRQPSGMVTLYNEDDELYPPQGIYLQDKDKIYIPRKTNLVSTFGQVAIPSFIPYEKGNKVKHYIKSSGGLLSNANKDYIYVKKQNGRIQKVSMSTKVYAGDEIIIMPKLNFKTLQFSKDMLDILYKTAVSVRVFTLL